MFSASACSHRPLAKEPCSCLENAPSPSSSGQQYTLANLDNALQDFCQADMLERDRQYAKAQAKIQSATSLVQLAFALKPSRPRIRAASSRVHRRVLLGGNLRFWMGAATNRRGKCSSLNNEQLDDPLSLDGISDFLGGQASNWPANLLDAPLESGKVADERGHQDAACCHAPGNRLAGIADGQPDSGRILLLDAFAGLHLR